MMSMINTYLDVEDTMQEIQVGNVFIQALEEWEGRPLKIAIGKDDQDGARFGGQTEDRVLVLSQEELDKLVAAANGLKRMLERDRANNDPDRVETLTKEDIVKTAKNFRWTRAMPKWTVIVNGVELPARPLVLETAGVPPNDRTNSHRAIAILKALGFDTRYEGRSV